MTRDDIIRMAKEAGYGLSLSDMHAPALERFAVLVAAAEREACIRKIRVELDQAERNSMRLEGQAGVRVSMIEAALDWIRARGGDVSDD